MTINEFDLLTLYKFGFIPKYLMEGWKRRHNRLHPLGDLQRAVKIITGCCVIAYICLGSAWAYYAWIPGSIDHALQITTSFLIIPMGAIGSALLTRRLSSGYRFLRKLLDLQNKVGFSMREFLMTSEKAMQKIASTRIQIFGSSVEAIETKYSRDSIEAEVQRDVFRKEHKLFLEFDLVDEKYDLYFPDSTAVKGKPSIAQARW